MTFHLPFSLSLALLSGAMAETFYLKNGKVLVGKLEPIGQGKFNIVSNKDGVNTRVAVLESDIAKTTKEDIELEMLKRIQELVPTPDLMTIDWYDEQIANLINSFRKEFPESRFDYDVKKVHEILLDEMKIIKEGGIKVSGKMVGAKERDAKAYDLDSQIEAAKFHQFEKEKKYGQAIEIADRMALDFSKSRAYGEVLGELPKICLKFKRKLDWFATKQKSEAAAAAKAESEMDPERFKLFKRARDLEMAAVEKRVAAQIEAGSQWPDVNRFSEASITNLQTKLETYLETVQKKTAAYIDLDAGSKYTKAWQHIERKEFELAKPHIDKLESLELNLGYLLRLQEFYFEEKDKEEERQRQIKRNYTPDIFEKYDDIDSAVTDTIYESIDYLNAVTDEETAKETHGRLMLYTSRLKRLFNRRSELEKLEPQDMEHQNAELAQSVEPLLVQLFDAHAKVEKDKALLAIISKSYENYKAALPNPEDFLTENAKRLIADNLRKQQSVDIKGALDPLAVLVKDDSFVKAPIAQTPQYYIFYYSASWCKFCKQSAPNVVKFYNEKIATNPNVELVMANLDKAAPEALVWGINEKFPFPVVLIEDHEKGYMNRFRPEEIPHFVMLDSKGFEITTNYDEIVNRVNELPKEVIKDAAAEAATEEAP